ncbi:MAG TPA: DUF4396 domain-containing protein, partial [Gemmatimonadales bacterium]|nr:DUF4396 domain-containing protein [Gemmatimonadales bacterium]
MLLQPFDVVVYIWLAIAVLSAGYVAVDQVRNNPEALVMKWGFILVTLYLGPIGRLLYVMADKEPAPGTHEQFVKPLWKQGVGSTVHCVAGDATGIIVAAAATALLGFPMFVDIMVEYVAGFLFGLLIFQALFMRRVMGGTYRENVRRSFMPEFLSMNMMMGGMAPVMIFLMMGRDMRAMWPGEPLFWFVMSLGVIAGFFVAYPINVWLVARGMKHGLMTVRAESEATGRMEHEGGKPHDATMRAGSMPGMTDGKQDPLARPTRTQLAALTGCTLLLLLAGMFVPAAFVNLSVRAEEVKSAIMPPGMIMTATTPADAMRDMAAADPRRIRFTAPAAARGDRLLQPRIENGVKVYQLDASIVRWNI